MGKEALYARINSCKLEIELNQTAILKLERKIELYEYIQGKVERGADNLRDFCNYQNEKIHITKSSYPKVKFVDGYAEDMTGYLQGQEFNQTMNEFLSASNKLSNKREMAIEQVNSLRRAISRLEEEIGLLDAQIREMERQEAEARVAQFYW